MILIVDDNPFFTDVMNRILMKRGFKFDIVNTGIEAIRRMLEHGQEYSLVLLDYRMSGVNGIEIAKTIRVIGDPEKSEVPIVLMSGADFSLDLSELQNLQVAGILYKPFLINDLVDTIKHNARFPIIGDVQDDATTERVGDSEEKAE